MQYDAKRKKSKKFVPHTIDSKKIKNEKKKTAVHLEKYFKVVFCCMGLSDKKTLGKNSLIIHVCAKLGDFFVKKSHLELCRRELRG